MKWIMEWPRKVLSPSRIRMVALPIQRTWIITFEYVIFYFFGYVARQIQTILFYSQRYGCRIRDHNQPLLITRSNARARRSGAPELVYLIPELCVMTGLTDEMRYLWITLLHIAQFVTLGFLFFRGNYQLMRALAQHTSLGPGERKNRLLQFNRRLNDIDEVSG